MGMRTYFFDIDGTLSDGAHRMHYITGNQKDWNAFYAACVDDAPIQHAVELAKTLSETHNIGFVTGRSEICRVQTLQWLFNNQLEGPLWMRAEHDYRQDTVVKMELMEAAKRGGYEPIIVFEDRTRNVEVFRKNGIPCYQVAAGDY